MNGNVSLCIMICEIVDTLKAKTPIGSNLADLNWILSP